MANTGWKSPTETGGTYNGWDNTPENAYASDDARASTTVGAISRERQSYETFNFGIPAGSTIDGVEIRVEHYETGASAQKLQVQWYSTSDASQSSVYQPPLRGSDTVDDGGGPVDLWGRTPIDTDFSNDNFHITAEGSAGADPPYNYFLDHVQVKVYYTGVVTTIALDGIPFPIPSDSKIMPIFPKKAETLNGKIRMDATKRKYQYEIHWRFIPVVDYNNLESIANSLEDIDFAYERYPQSQNGVLVKAELGERSHAALSSNGFYSNITVKLMEVSSRI